MSKSLKNCAVFYHIFYEDTIHSIEEELQYLHQYQPAFFFNISADMPNTNYINYELKKKFPGCHTVSSSNKGKDIGGKLLLLKLYFLLRRTSTWFLFLHDKKSLQAVNAELWRKELFRIVQLEELNKIEQIALQDSKCGIIAAKDCIKYEKRVDGTFVSINQHHMQSLVNRFNLKPSSYNYVGGTMFWARATIMEQFFKLIDPLYVRAELESGNVLDDQSGTLTHSWERLLSWIYTSSGMEIRSV